MLFLFGVRMRKRRKKGERRYRKATRGNKTENEWRNSYHTRQGLGCVPQKKQIEIVVVY